MMYSKLETITPEIATEYLKANHSNRNVQRSTVRNYARDMRNGCWQLTSAGISFYENGELADGQHRLYAVIEAGVPVDMYVTYGVPNTSSIFDRGRIRTVANIMSMSGVNSSIAQNPVISGVRYLFKLCGNDRVTDNILIEFCKTNEQTLDASISAVRSGVGHAICQKAPIIAAAFCSLYCGVNEGLLRQFFTIVNTGFYNNARETSAIVLRNYLLKDYHGMNASSKKALFETTVSAIMDFMAMTPRKRPYRSGGSCYYFDVVKKEVLDEYLSSYVA